MLGGYFLGVIESLTKAYISTTLTDAVVFGILIIMLLVKPTGLLGRNGKEKV
jgi:branched-chain amino acid transport system permease protein